MIYTHTGWFPTPVTQYYPTIHTHNQVTSDTLVDPTTRFTWYTLFTDIPTHVGRMDMLADDRTMSPTFTRQDVFTWFDSPE